MTFRPMHEVEFSADDDVLLLREAVRLKPFMESERGCEPVWSRVGTTLSANKSFRRKFGSTKSPHSLMRYRFRFLMDMRREEQARGGSQRHVSAAHREREDLLDTCLALEKDKPTYRFSMRDHILILRATVSVFSRRSRGSSQDNWDAVAKEVRSQPLFSKPTVNGKAVQRVVEGLKTKLRRRGSGSGAPVDADHQERAELLDRFIEIINGQSNALTATRLTKRQPKADAAAKATNRQSKADVPSTPAEQVATIRPKRVTRRPQRLVEQDDVAGIESRGSGDSESEFTVSEDDECESDWSAQQPNKRAVEEQTPVNSISKKQKIEDDPDTVEMIRLRLEADARRREHELRVAEQRAMQVEWQQEVAERRAALEQARQERVTANRDVQVQVAKAVAEGISTGIAAILPLLKAHAALRCSQSQSTPLPGQ
ncbi:hypothetical protein PINS_up012456 [Pythium insidiosum]|nr:hypothetical protein PINS_up012456 [Pythium insidiosum]